jgi:alkylation response protein AidB-like acyl-CoA dehydrogenase
MTAQVLNVPAGMAGPGRREHFRRGRARLHREGMPAARRPLGKGRHLWIATVWNKAGEAVCSVPVLLRKSMAAPAATGPRLRLPHGCVRNGRGWLGRQRCTTPSSRPMSGITARKSKRRNAWLPKLATGEYVGAIAMTEPGAGSDLQGIKTTAKKDGNGYVINGSKTFITNGGTANFIIVVAKTDPKAGAKGTSLFMIETDEAGGLPPRPQSRQGRAEVPGHRRAVLRRHVGARRSAARRRKKARAFPADAAIAAGTPADRRSGRRHDEARAGETINYVKERQAFGKAVIGFQNTQFKLAELKTKATIAEVFVQHCSASFLKGQLDAATASMAKYWDHRHPVRADRRMRAAAWRLRLHERVSGGAHVPRCAGAAHLWRHQRDHEAADRTDAVGDRAACHTLRGGRLARRLHAGLGGTRSGCF